jgi:predicted TIM-barrel fold metal-dependent hydrolase
MKIIDCHANLGWDISNTRKKLFPTNQSAKELLFKMDENKIVKSIILPFPSPGGQFSDNACWYEVENQMLINAMRSSSSSSSSSRLIPFAGVNPGDACSVKNIKTLAVAYAIKGIKFSHQIPMGFNIDDLIGHPLMKIVQDYHLIMMIHIGTGKERGAERIHTTLPYAIKVAKYYPGVRFIFCHLGRLHKDIFDALQLHNVWTDTAGFSLSFKWSEFSAKDPAGAFKKLTPIEIIELFVGQGFEDKIMFGSDEPYTHYEKELEIIQNASISNEAKKKILAVNIENLLKK